VKPEGSVDAMRIGTAAATYDGAEGFAWVRGRYFPPAMAAPTLRHDPYASLRIAGFRWFIISLLTMNVATQL
jgi:hypothetical protein